MYYLTFSPLSVYGASMQNKILYTLNTPPSMHGHRNHGAGGFKGWHRSPFIPHPLFSADSCITQS